MCWLGRKVSNWLGSPLTRAPGGGLARSQGRGRCWGQSWTPEAAGLDAEAGPLLNSHRFTHPTSEPRLLPLQRGRELPPTARGGVAGGAGVRAGPEHLRAVPA